MPVTLESGAVIYASTSRHTGSLVSGNDAGCRQKVRLSLLIKFSESLLYFILTPTKQTLPSIRLVSSKPTLMNQLLNAVSVMGSVRRCI